MLANFTEALRKAELFHDLSDTVLSALAAKAVARTLKRNEILFIAGDAATGLYVIVSGSVRAYRAGPDGREQIIHTEQAGATIGEIPLFDQQPYPSTVAAEEDSIVLFIDRQYVIQTCQLHPEIALAALRVLSKRLRKCAALVETLSLRDVGQRLAQFILNEAVSHGSKCKDGIEVTIPLSREQLAARVGSVREVVSRALSRLDEEGLIQVEGPRIAIPDVPQLKEYIANRM